MVYIRYLKQGFLRILMRKYGKKHKSKTVMFK